MFELLINNKDYLGIIPFYFSNKINMFMHQFYMLSRTTPQTAWSLLLLSTGFARIKTEFSGLPIKHAHLT